jgi:hypothetical protein
LTHGPAAASTTEGLDFAVARAWSLAVTVRVAMISGDAHPRFGTGATTLGVLPASVD